MERVAAETSSDGSSSSDGKRASRASFRRVRGSEDPNIETSYDVDSFVVMVRGFASLRASRDVMANAWGKRAYPPRNRKAFAHFTQNHTGKWYEFKFCFTAGATVNLAFQWANSSNTDLMTAKKTFVTEYLLKAIDELPPKCQTRLHGGGLDITRENQWVRVFPQDWDGLAAILDRRMAEGYERHGWRNWRIYIFRHGMKCHDFKLAHRDIADLLNEDKADVVGIDVHAAVVVGARGVGGGAIVALHSAAKRALERPNLVTTSTAFLDDAGGFFGPCSGDGSSSSSRNGNITYAQAYHPTAHLHAQRGYVDPSFVLLSRGLGKWSLGGEANLKPGYLRVRGRTLPYLRGIVAACDIYRRHGLELRIEIVETWHTLDAFYAMNPRSQGDSMKRRVEAFLQHLCSEGVSFAAPTTPGAVTCDGPTSRPMPTTCALCSPRSTP